MNTSGNPIRYNVLGAPDGHQTFRKLRDDRSQETGVVRCECGREHNLNHHSEHLRERDRAWQAAIA